MDEIQNEGKQNWIESREKFKIEEKKFLVNGKNSGQMKTKSE